MKRQYGYVLLILLALAAGTFFLWPRPARALIASHECNFCHQLHGAPGFSLLKNPQIEVLCLTCHGPGGISTLKAEVHNPNNVDPSHYQYITCRQCHDVHDNKPNFLGGVNIKLVGSILDATGLAKIRVPTAGGTGPIVDVAFEAETGDPSFNNNTFDSGLGYGTRACEVCHSGNHNAGRNCNTSGCHPHSLGFPRP